MPSLKEQFEELIHMPWDEFVEMEKDKNITNDEAILCSLIRLCADTDEIAAMKMAFDRIDGPQEIPIQFKIPKFYVRYVNARRLEKSTEKRIEAGTTAETDQDDLYDPLTSTLRQTLHKMRGLPKQIVPAVLTVKKAIDDGKPVGTKVIPQVKSVMVANLLKNVRKGRTRAVELVFDQIDGKLTKTITLLGGEDVYVDDFHSLEAPAHAVLDDNGVYMAEDKRMTTLFLRGFAQSNKGLESLAKGLEDE